MTLYIVQLWLPGDKLIEEQRFEHPSEAKRQADDYVRFVAKDGRTGRVARMRVDGPEKPRDYVTKEAIQKFMGYPVVFEQYVKPTPEQFDDIWEQWFWNAQNYEQPDDSDEADWWKH